MLSHYNMLERLGTGGMGTVWRARDLRDGSIVAVKVLHAHLAADAEYVRRFEREARIAASLDSPNIVRVLDSGVEGESRFLVIEYVEGKTLAQHIHDRGRLDVAETVAISTAIASALDAAHKSGIVHRDISPQNVLIQPDGTVKVTDFGIARDLGATAMTATSMLLGKPQYVAPEAVTGSSPVDIRSDIYSLGVVMYQMLTGAAPFNAATPYAILRMQEEREPPALDRARGDVPDWLSAVIDRCLAKQPRDRFQLPIDLVDALGPGPHIQVARPRPGSRRGLALLACTGVLGLAVFAAVLGTTLLSGEEPTVEGGDERATSAQQAAALAVTLEPNAISPASSEEPSRAATEDQDNSSAVSPNPTAQVPQDRTVCAEIAGTPYRSENERQWYIANCLQPTAGPAPTAPATAPVAGPAPTAPAPASATGSRTENFNAGFNPLRTGSPPGATFDVQGQALVLRNNSQGYYAHAFVGEFRNSRAAVDILWTGTGTSDDKGGGVGLACRRPGDASSTDYRIEVNPATSQFRLIKLKDAVSFSGIGLTTFVHWTPLPLRWEANASHRLELSCNGSQIEAKLDGLILGQATDAELVSGQVTLFGQGIVEVAFDNLVVTELP
jgi:serine/threonine-protein kinase